MTAGDQTVVSVGKLKNWQKGDGLMTPVAEPSANTNPIVVLIVGLFASSAMTDNGITQTDGAGPGNGLHSRGPIGDPVVLLSRHWDKKNHRRREAPFGAARQTKAVGRGIEAVRRLLVRTSAFSESSAG